MGDVWENVRFEIRTHWVLYGLRVYRGTGGSYWYVPLPSNWEIIGQCDKPH